MDAMVALAVALAVVAAGAAVVATVLAHRAVVALRGVVVERAERLGREAAVVQQELAVTATERDALQARLGPQRSAAEPGTGTRPDGGSRANSR